MTTAEFELRCGKCRNTLMITARKMLPPEACEDAVQSAMLSAWEHLGELRSDAAFDSWIRQILLNECRAYYRKRHKDNRTSRAFADMLISGPADTGLRDALNELSESEKELLLQHHDQGYSLSELSQKTGESESVLKMRLYRARKRLRIALISLLLLLLMITAAIAAGHLDVNWFLFNRRASNPPLYHTDSRSDCSISYSGRLLHAEISDAVWDMERRCLLLTYSLTGATHDTLAVHSGNIGVDGKRHNHIWVDDQILPIDHWANGESVYVYSLDGWKNGDTRLHASEDYLTEGRSDSFFAELHFDTLDAQQYEKQLNSNGDITLTNQVFIFDYASGILLEEGTLSARIAAPDTKTRRIDYEAYSD